MEDMVTKTVEEVVEKAMSKKEIVVGATVIGLSGLGIGLAGHEIYKKVKTLRDSKKKTKEVVVEETTTEETEEK